MKDGAGISPSLRQASEPDPADRRLDGCKIPRGDVQGAMIITGPLCWPCLLVASHRFGELISQGRDSGVANGDGVEKICMTSPRIPGWMGRDDQSTGRAR